MRRGGLIGFGVIANTIYSSHNPILGAALFSLGLLSIIHLQLPLFTGRVGYRPPLKFLIKCLLLNWVGCGAVTFAAFELYPTFALSYWAIVHSKFQQPALHFLIGGFLCGILIHLTTRCKNDIITIAAVMMFILTTMEHSIADFPYALVGGVAAWGKLGLAVIGNTIGGMLLEIFLVKENEITST